MANFRINIILGLILIISGLIPIIFVSSNQTKLLWGCGRYPECGYNGNDTFYVPPNPFGKNQYIIEVRAWLTTIGGYFFGNITFTHQGTDQTYFFEYMLGQSSLVGGDIELEVWTMQPGLYSISWENDDFYLIYSIPFSYEFSSVAIGYPNEILLFIGAIIILVVFGIVALLLWISAYEKYESRPIRTKSEVLTKESNIEGVISLPKTVKSIFEDQSSVYFQQGQEFAKNNQLNKALEFYNKSLATFSGSPTVLFEKASVLLQLNRFSEAFECVNKVLDFQPNNFKAQKLKNTLLNLGVDLKF